MTDYKRVAETLRAGSMYYPSLSTEREQFATAVSLCERMASGELVERARVRELASGSCWHGCRPAALCPVDGCNMEKFQP